MNRGRNNVHTHVLVKINFGLFACLLCVLFLRRCVSSCWCVSIVIRRQNLGNKATVQRYKIGFINIVLYTMQKQRVVKNNGFDFLTGLTFLLTRLFLAFVDWLALSGFIQLSPSQTCLLSFTLPQCLTYHLGQYICLCVLYPILCLGSLWLCSDFALVCGDSLLFQAESKQCKVRSPWLITFPRLNWFGNRLCRPQMKPALLPNPNRNNRTWLFKVCTYSQSHVQNK